MTTRTAAPPSVLALDGYRDVAIRIAFRMADPIGLTEVALDPEPGDNGQLLQLLEAALVRLATYRRDFIAAELEDVTPSPAPIALHGPGREG